MELLDLSGNHGGMERLYVDSSCSSLETVIIDHDSGGLKEISLKGCAKLKNLLLKGLFPNLYSLDLTGTAVETAYLSGVTAPKLDELFLLDCEKLCAVLWPPPGEDGRKRFLGKLHIDTTQKEGTAAAFRRSRSPAEFGWYICVRVARLLGSLEAVEDYFGHNEAHLEISTSVASLTRSPADADGRKDVRIKRQNLQQVKDNATYAYVAATLEDTAMQQADNGDSDDSAPAIMCICPPAPCVSSQGCYIHIQDQMSSTKLQTAGHITVPGYICDSAKVLHVHDGLFITLLQEALSGSGWNQLEWCRVERCPKLEYVFRSKLGEGNSSGVDAFNKLRTIWMSHLPNAKCIVSQIGLDLFQTKQIGLERVNGAFRYLTLRHLYCCPRLMYVVSFWDRISLESSFESLETLEIRCCDLRKIFACKVVRS